MELALTVFLWTASIFVVIATILLILIAIFGIDIRRGY